MCCCRVHQRTDEGIADFHAAGRHTHITELLRNGVTLPEARELARHSDIRMTMEYAHIGIDDQAKAVSKLPWYRTGESENTSNEDDEDSGAQRPASGTRHLNGHLLSSSDTETTSTGTSDVASKPLENSGSDALLPLLSPPDNEAENLQITGSIPAASTFYDATCLLTGTCGFTGRGFATRVLFFWSLCVVSWHRLSSFRLPCPYKPQPIRSHCLSNVGNRLPSSVAATNLVISLV